MIDLNGLPGLSAWLVYNKVVFGLIFCRDFNFRVVDQSNLIASLDDCVEISDFIEVREALTTNRLERVEFSVGECLRAFKAAPVQVKRALLLECMTFVALADDESIRLISLHEDANGVRIGRHSLANYDSGQLMDFMLETMIACSEVDCDFGLMDSEDSEALGKYRVDIRSEANKVLSRSPSMPVGDLLSVALKAIAGKFKGSA